MLFRDFEQKIVKIINESGMPIDAIYFIMKNIMHEIEEKYFEYCKIEDAEIAKAKEKSDLDTEEPVSANEGDKLE